jgi:hypothetical protein
LHGPGADDDLRHLLGDGGYRSQSGRGPERHLEQWKAAVKQRSGERNRIRLSLDRQDRDHGHTAEQAMHAFLPA